MSVKLGTTIITSQLKPWVSVFCVLFLGLSVNTFSQILTISDQKSFEIRSISGKTKGYITADTIIPLGPETYAAGFASSDSVRFFKWAIADLKGYISPPLYDSIQSVSGEVLIGYQKGNFNLLSKEGEVLITNKSYASFSSTGPWLYLKNQDGDDKCISIYNVYSKTLVADSISSFLPETNGVFCVKNRGRWGGFSNLGAPLVPYQYDSIVAYMPSKIAILDSGGWGLINDQNEWIFRPAFNKIVVTINGLTIVQDDTSGYLLDEANNKIAGGRCDLFWVTKDNWIVQQTDSAQWIFTPEGCRIGDPIAVLRLGQDTIGLFKDGAKWQYRGRQGQVLSFGFSLQHTPLSEIGILTNGFAVAKHFGKYGYISVEGLKRISPRYDSALAFQEGRGAIKLKALPVWDGWGFVDRKDSLVAQPRYDSVGYYCDSIVVVKKQGRYQLLNYYGIELLPNYITTLQYSNTGGYILFDENQFGYISGGGNLRLQIKYQQIKVFNQYLTAFKSNTGKWGLHDISGKLSLEPVFSFMDFNPYSGDLLLWQKRYGY